MRRRVPFFTTTIVVAGFCGWVGWLWQPHLRSLTFRTFDVGQGDALFIETPNRQQLLIDGGPGRRVLAKLGSVMPLFDRTIDVVVLTNPDKDHMEGFLEVVKRYRIGRFVMTGVERKERSEMYDVLRELLMQKNIPVQYVKDGDRFIFDGGIGLTILSPKRNLRGVATTDVNETSVVARLDFFHFSALFTGDATGTAEQELVRTHARLAASVLKVSHHGSKYSSTEEFLDAVHPMFAVISAGRKNPYGHPHAETLARLLRRDIDISVTADGDVCLKSFGDDSIPAGC